MNRMTNKNPLWSPLSGGQRAWVVPGLFLLFTILFACEGKQEKKVHSGFEAPNREFPSQEIWNSSLTLSHGGKLQAVVRYGHMVRYENRKTAFFDQDVQVDFFDEQGKHTSQLHSDRGEYNETTEEVKGIGQVVVVSDTGITLYTPFIKWDPRISKIQSDSAVMVTTQKLDTLYGFGFESTSNLDHWTIKKASGVTQKHVNFKKFESEFTKPSDSDSSGGQKRDTATLKNNTKN
jgi:LPS export ABC transporter protein LptC